MNQSDTRQPTVQCNVSHPGIKQYSYVNRCSVVVLATCSALRRKRSEEFQAKQTSKQAKLINHKIGKSTKRRSDHNKPIINCQLASTTLPVSNAPCLSLPAHNECVISEKKESHQKLATGCTSILVAENYKTEK